VKIPYIEVGGETLQMEKARRLIAAATSTADQLERDDDTAVMHDDNGGALFGGRPMNATEWRALADQLAAALLEAESAGSL
jgi:hypothetical protein